MMAREVKKLLVICAGVAALLLAVAAVPQAAGPGSLLPPGFQDTVALDGLKEPVAFRFSPDGRVFVAEKAGRIVVFDDLDDETPTEFADMRKQVYDYADRGLLGLALDPEFPVEPYVYALYTFDHVLGEDPPGVFGRWGDPDTEYEGDSACAKLAEGVDACPVSGRLTRLTAAGGGNQAVHQGGAPLEHVLITDWCQMNSSHSVGDLEFGPEGALYASGGEGSYASGADYGQFGYPHPNMCADPPGGFGVALKPPEAEGGALRAQDLLTPAPHDPTGLAGTVIRVDADTGAGLPGNPLQGSADANERRIIAFGFRNPFRFALHPDTGEVYVSNVSGGPEEEIDRFAAIPATTYNSGWPCVEGSIRNDVYEAVGLDLCKQIYDNPGLTSVPFFSYNRHLGVSSGDPCPTANGSAISGSVFYEGAMFPPAYEGALFFSDSVRGCLYVMFAGEDGRPDPTTTVPFVTESDLYPGVDIQVGPDGALYYAALFGQGFGPGSIHRVAYFPGNQPPVARLTATPEWAPGSLTSVLDATGSTDAEGEDLLFEWDPEGDGTYELPSSDGDRELTFNDGANHVVAVRVSDEENASAVARVTLYPGNTPPQVSIEEPLEGPPGSGEAVQQWRVGDPIEFEGSATDAEDWGGGPMPETSLDWSSRLYHCPNGSGGCHAHPLRAFPSADSGTLTAPDHEYPSRIELKLTATDSRGLTASRTIILEPVPVTLSLESVPAGIPLTAGTASEEAPFQLTAVENASVTVSAPQSAVVGGLAYEFFSWSDGGDRVHTIQAQPSATRYTAIYTREGSGADPGGGEKPGGEQPGTSPPATQLLNHPRKRSHARRARFSFFSETGVEFRCRLDRRPYRGCASPRAYRGLAPGAHVFRVFAIDAAGRGDPTPVVFRWKVLRR
jgi:glucose/arabinose dehydrogenase